MAQRGAEVLPRRMRNLDLQDQQGDGDGDDAVGERLEPGSVGGVAFIPRWGLRQVIDAL